MPQRGTESERSSGFSRTHRDRVHEIGFLLTRGSVVLIVSGR
jgi:hypothetical protein